MTHPGGRSCSTGPQTRMLTYFLVCGGRVRSVAPLSTSLPGIAPLILTRPAGTCGEVERSNLIGSITRRRDVLRDIMTATEVLKGESAPTFNSTELISPRERTHR